MMMHPAHRERAADEGAVLLVAALIEQARRDARRGNLRARQWLDEVLAEIDLPANVRLVGQGGRRPGAGASSARPAAAVALWQTTADR